MTLHSYRRPSSRELAEACIDMAKRCRHQRITWEAMAAIIHRRIYRVCVRRTDKRIGGGA